MAARPPKRPRSDGRPRTHEWVLARVPADVRDQIDRWAEAWLTRKFSHGLALRAADPRPFNYPVKVYSEWRGKAFYLCALYRTPAGRERQEFVVRRARMTMTGFGRFDLAFVRHTERWFTAFRGLTAADCIRHIEGNEVFWPII